MVVTSISTAAYIERLKAVRDPSVHTLKAYTCDLNDYAGFLAARDLCARAPATLIAYAHHLMSDRSAAPRTLRRRMACLRGFYKDLVRARVLEQSPFAELEMNLPRPRSLPRSLTRDEARKLAEAAWSIAVDARHSRSRRRFAAAVLLLISVGLRVGELVQLRPQDFDPESGALRVRGKGGRERCVFVVDGGLRLLIAEFGRTASSGTLLGPIGDTWSTQAARRALRRFSKEAGVERAVTPHMLRHTCATLLLEDGVDLRFLQRLLGHQNITTTAIYAHVGDSGLRRALEKAGLLSSLQVSGRPGECLATT
jgi:integrase/recombinase XerD